MQYFVTGATGFVGSHLVEQLVAAGHEVVALVRPTSDTDRLPPVVERVQGDITDRASMRAGMAGVDGVFHLAAWYRIGDPDEALAERVNVDGTRTVLELVEELAIPRAVYTSSLAINSDTQGAIVDESYRYDGPHLSVYDRTKWQAHYGVVEPMAAAGVPVITVQPGVIYGPGAAGPSWQLWETYLAGDLPVIPRRAGACFEHVEDTARSLRLAMEHGQPGETYIIAGTPLTYIEAFRIAASITGIDAPRPVPPALFSGASRLAGAIEGLVRPPVRYSAEALRVLAGVTYWGDNSKATRALGIDHRPFEEGLAETLTPLD